MFSRQNNSVFFFRSECIISLSSQAFLRYIVRDTFYIFAYIDLYICIIDVYTSLKVRNTETKTVGIFMKHRICRSGCSVFTDRATYDTIVYLRPCTVEMHPSRQPNRLPIPTYPLHLHTHPALEVAIALEKTKCSGRQWRNGRWKGNREPNRHGKYTEKMFRRPWPS